MYVFKPQLSDDENFKELLIYSGYPKDLIKDITIEKFEWTSNVFETKVYVKFNDKLKRALRKESDVLTFKRATPIPENIFKDDKGNPIIFSQYDTNPNPIGLLAIAKNNLNRTNWFTNSTREKDIILTSDRPENEYLGEFNITSSIDTENNHMVKSITNKVIGSIKLSPATATLRPVEYRERIMVNVFRIPQRIKGNDYEFTMPVFQHNPEPVQRYYNFPTYSGTLPKTIEETLPYYLVRSFGNFDEETSKELKWLNERKRLNAKGFKYDPKISDEVIIFDKLTNIKNWNKQSIGMSVDISLDGTANNKYMTGNFKSIFIKTPIRNYFFMKMNKMHHLKMSFKVEMDNAVFEYEEFNSMLYSVPGGDIVSDDHVKVFGLIEDFTPDKGKNLSKRLVKEILRLDINVDLKIELVATEPQKKWRGVEYHSYTYRVSFDKTTQKWTPFMEEVMWMENNNNYLYFDVLINDKYPKAFEIPEFELGSFIHVSPGYV